MPFRVDSGGAESDAQHVAPPVFGAEYAGYESDEGVAIYILCDRVGAQDREAQIELHEDGNGRLVMLAYSSLEELVGCCGEAQPWISVQLPDVGRVQGDCGADAVLWDISLSQDVRRTGSAEGNEL